jgi:hypothetical protein
MMLRDAKELGPAAITRRLWIERRSAYRILEVQEQAA